MGIRSVKMLTESRAESLKMGRATITSISANINVNH